LPGVAAVLATLHFGAPASAAVDVLETYDDLGPGSSVTVRFDLNNDFVFDATFTGPLRGRADVALRFADAGPAAALEGLRVKRLTLFAEPVIQLESSGYAGTAKDISVHMGDGLGQASGHAQLGIRLGTGILTWTQSGTAIIEPRGTVRGGGPSGFAELLDLADVEPFAVDALTGEWEWRDFGGQSRFRLVYGATHFLSLLVPVRTSITVVVEQTKPFALPATPLDYSAWTLANGLAGADADINADRDGDGRVNLDEFASGLDPTVAEAAQAPVAVELRNGEPVYIFDRDTTRTGLEIRLQSSQDLVSWKTTAAALPDADVSGVAGGVVLEEKSLGAGRYRVVVRGPSTTLDDRHRFARLELVRR
jgi:hypothetical protein